jgi:sterol desaturase/sphingolipid hydroxylase (fatty acid hydroxylase superfamily)
MRDFISRHLYALAVGGSVAVFLTGRALALPLEPIVLGWSVLTLAAGALLERWMPFERGWQRAQGDAATDATSAVVLIGIVDPLLKAALPVLAIAALGAFDLHAPAPRLPFALQVVLALLWIEFAKYWSHRWHHALRPLWWLHALHHGSRRLYWLNNFRFHPLNHSINTAASLLPLWLLGVSPEVLLAATAVTQPVTMLQHVNVDLRSGWLNRVFSTNELHRWHHSSDPREANANFGSSLVLWDQVFGTYRHAPQNAPVSIGLFGGGAYPAGRSYLRQLGSMFHPSCC